MSGVTFYNGVDGTVSAPLNLKVFKWVVARQSVLQDKSGFGDNKQRKLSEGKVAYSISLAGHAQSSPSTKISVTGTVFIGAWNGTHTYNGVAYIKQCVEANDYNSSNDAPVLLAAEFDGDPTSA